MTAAQTAPESPRADRPTPPRALLRPLEPRDLAHVPPGWTAGPPDWVGIGCGKSGSTWWHEMLLQHPQVVPNRAGEKELHHFSHFDYRGPSAEAVALYRELFARPPGAISGEFTGTYLTLPLALSHLAEAAPGARLIALVRNPIDRAVSTYNQFARKRARFFDLDPERERILETFSLLPEALGSCRVAAGFREVARRFPPEQLLVLQYERCKRDPAGEMRRCLAFLGVDADWAPADPERPVNRRPYVVPRPDADGRARLRDYYVDDVEELLERFPTLDRALWPDFA